MMRLRPLMAADRQSVRDLITAHFSDNGSYTVTVNDESNGVYARVVEADGSIRGVMALTRYDTKAELGEAMHLVDTVAQIPTASIYGLIHMGYVASDHTGEGIGSRLLDRLHAIGAREGVDVFVSDAWFHGGTDTPEHLLRNHGYEVAFKRPLSGGHAEDDCPKCTGECVCEAALTVRTS